MRTLDPTNTVFSLEYFMVRASRKLVHKIVHDRKAEETSHSTSRMF